MNYRLNSLKIADRRPVLVKDWQVNTMLPSKVSVTAGGKRKGNVKVALNSNQVKSAQAGVHADGGGQSDKSIRWILCEWAFIEKYRPTRFAFAESDPSRWAQRGTAASCGRSQRSNIAKPLAQYHERNIMSATWRSTAGSTRPVVGSVIADR
jgi:hypothetical protein